MKKIYILSIIAVVLLAAASAVWLVRPVVIFGKDLPFVATLVQPTENYKRNNLYKLHIAKREGTTLQGSLQVMILKINGADGHVSDKGFFSVKAEDIDKGKTYEAPASFYMQRAGPRVYMPPYDWTFEEYDTVVISHTEFNPIVIKCVKGGSVQIK